jgi:DNA modification methylase
VYVDGVGNREWGVITSISPSSQLVFVRFEGAHPESSGVATPKDSVFWDSALPDDHLRISTLETGVYCGDALDLIRLLPDESVDLLLTDPPYNVTRKNNFHTIGRAGIEFSWDGGFDQERWLRLVVPKLKRGANIAIFNDWKNLGSIARVLDSLGCEPKRRFHYEKQNPFPRNIERSSVQRCEDGVWAVKKGAPWVFNKSKDKPYEDLIFSYPVPQVPKGTRRHQAMKPRAMFEEMLRIWSDPGAVVLDPFSGSGPVFAACGVLGRRCVAFELDPEWVEISRRNITG